MAWYTASNNANVTNASPASTGTITVGESTYSATNEFTIQPVVTTADATLAYTDTDGKTYVSVPNGDGTYTKQEAELASDVSKAVAITLKAKVTYSGDLNDKAVVEALFKSEVNTVTLTVSCTAVGGTTVSGTAATSDIRFVSNATANASGDDAKLKSNADFTWSTYATTAELEFGTVYAALTGSDSLIVDATHIPTYTLTVTATHA